jgi:hypothetical protein
MNEKIDIVYTWVNSSDKNWQKGRGIYWEKIKHGDNRNIRYPVSSDPSCELKLSIQSILKYASWVNKIFIITCRPQIPTLPKLFNKKIKIIHHDEIWNNTSELPTFNSHAIEANIHRIKNLSEKFIYFNDDCYISNYIYPGDFFYKNLPKISGKNKMRNIDNKDITTAYIGAHLNLFKIMKNYYFEQTHHAVPLTVKLMKESEKYFEAYWSNTIKSKFRSNTDIPPISAAISYGLLKNNIIPIKNIIFCSEDINKYLNSNYSGKFVCINNCHIIKKDHIKLANKILQKYPEKIQKKLIKIQPKKNNIFKLRINQLKKVI